MTEPTLRPLDFDYRSVQLTPEEGFVLSRIDQPVFARDVAAMTGLPRERVNEIVQRLLEMGAIAVDGNSPVRRSVSSMNVAASTPPGNRMTPAPESTPRNSRLTPAPSSTGRPSAARVSAGSVGVRGESERPSSGWRVRSSMTPPPTTEGLQLYQQHFAGLGVSERANRAQRAEGDELVALCHDPHPQVVHALMANRHFTPRFARLVALYHKNPSGLELVARDRDLIADAKVQLCLLLNPHLTEAVLRRLVKKAGLGDLHRLALDPRVPDDLREHVAQALRERFSSADGEERADLVYWSDGDALELLRGCSFDERTTALLCNKTYTSPNLVRSLAKFSGTPPGLLSALLEQPLVAERPDLQQAVLAHPNSPRRAGTNG